MSETENFWNPNTGQMDQRQTISGEDANAAADSKINKGLGSVIKKTDQAPTPAPSTGGADPEPKADDYPGLGAFANAHNAWKDRQASKNPQATAVKGMLQKRGNVDATVTDQK